MKMDQIIYEYGYINPIKYKSITHWLDLPRLANKLALELFDEGMVAAICQISIGSVNKSDMLIWNA